MVCCCLAAIAITLAPAPSAAPVPEDFVGLSFEAAQVNATPEGHWYFDAGNQELIATFRRLGVRHLRIGGNTADIGANRLPTHADLDRLFAFARAADVKVLYCLRLAEGDPEEDAALAGYLMRRFPDRIDAFSIGQEPSAYAGPAKGRKLNYDEFAPRWERFASVIRAQVPGVPLAGPSVHNDPAWTARFVTEFGSGHGLRLVTAHLYPGGSGRAVIPEAGIRRMLGPEFLAVDRRLWLGLTASATAAGLPFRIEESNSFYNGGAAGVSDTYAATLWGLDFILWWASHGAAGIDFHTGDRVSAGVGENLAPAKYTAYVSAAGGAAYDFRPLGYGLVAARLSLGPTVLQPEAKDALPASLHIYGFRRPQSETLIAINLAYGPGATDAILSWTGTLPSAVEMVRVSASDGTVFARSGIAVTPWSRGEGTVKLRPASAVILRRALGPSPPTPRG